MTTRTEPRIDRGDLKQLQDVVADRYDPNALERDLYYALEKKLSNYSGKEKFLDVVFDVLKGAEQESWMRGLLGMFINSNYPAVGEVANRILDKYFPVSDIKYESALAALHQGQPDRALDLLAAARAEVSGPVDPMMELRRLTLGLTAHRMMGSEGQAESASARSEVVQLVDAIPPEQIAEDSTLLVALASEIGEERPAVVLQALLLTGLRDLSFPQTQKLTSALAQWDACNDHLPASELQLPGGPESQPQAWAEWLQNSPTKRSTQTLANILNRYPDGDPVIAALSSIYRESLSSSQAPTTWAICCSGGGIRSAAYCLGALQSLDKGGLLAKAKWILGISGGSYIAASRALVAADLPTGTQPRAYAPGTPEERHLRHSTRHIGPDGATVLVGVLSLLLGAVVTFVVVLAPLYALAHAWGWLLRWQEVLVPSGQQGMTASVTGLGWWLPPVIVAVITLVLFAFWWLTLAPTAGRTGGRARLLDSLQPDASDRGANRAAWVGWAAGVAAGLAIAMLAVPPLIAWLTRATGSLGTITHFLGFGGKPSWSPAALAGLVAAVAAVARYAQAGLAKWTALGRAAQAGSATAKPDLMTRLAGWLRQQVLPWLGSVLVVLVGVVLALLWTCDGARAGFTPNQLLLVLDLLVVMLLIRVAANVNRLSMHDFYRWRLANAFAVTRRAAGGLDQVQTRALFARAAAARLSGLRDAHGGGAEPGLVICGTANINALREVPPGQGGFCISFDPQHVTLHREKALADQEKAIANLQDLVAERARALTSDYEALIGYRRSTLFDVSAISGAAVSPLMGSMTKYAYRILLTATNVRLGVWLPHPALIRDARKLIDHPDRHYVGQGWERRPLRLLLWYLLPHPFWDRQPKRNSDREALLWAHVLRLRLRGGRSGSLWYRAMQPTLGLLWAEAAGRLSYRSTWMYVTDGGHYDNLGLVEALRRGASNIVVLDASGDKADTWFTLGDAISLAGDDAGVDIELDPTTMIRGKRKLAPGQVVHPWAHGRFYRQQPVPGLPAEGEIWVCKLGWWAGAPWDVVAYAKSHSTFPGDSTLEQLHHAREFEAYQKLGAATVRDAAKRCEPPLTVFTPVPSPAP